MSENSRRFNNYKFYDEDGNEKPKLPPKLKLPLFILIPLNKKKIIKVKKEKKQNAANIAERTFKDFYNWHHKHVHNLSDENRELSIFMYNELLAAWERQKKSLF